MQPAYLFETSWEVCQKIGGIYTVLSTRARILQTEHKDNVFFIGPDIQKQSTNPYFRETPSLLAGWQRHAHKQGLKVRVGRWLVPGRPIALLIDFDAFYAQKNTIYGHFWERYGLDSLHAYGDYDESCMFAYAAGVVIESIYHYLHLENQAVTAHFNEWQTAFGLLYLKEHCPRIGTLFTTHATTVGRSIAGNNKPLYDYFEGYHGDQMALELNVQSKHSAEKTAAHNADCFTTVSDITARECAQLLDRQVDIVTPNGFEMNFAPQTNKTYRTIRTKARQCLHQVAEHVLGHPLPQNTLFALTSGRYEWKNKGLDITHAAISQLAQQTTKNTPPITLFQLVPAWTTGQIAPRGNGILTHTLHEPQNDPTWQSITQFNNQHSTVNIIFAPVYLDGRDGLFNLPYYDLLAGFDLSLFPSYYEPWGYTPLESIAFRVPTITTNLSGFGRWAEQQPAHSNTCLTAPVTIIHRTDSNFHEAAQAIAQHVLAYLQLSDSERDNLRQQAYQLALQATWEQFFSAYREAYVLALQNK